MLNSSKVQDKDFQEEPIHNSFTSPIHKNRDLQLTHLQRTIVQRILEIHENEGRAVSYRDFKDIAHDVIRQEFRILKRINVIERATDKRTVPAWYKVKGASIKWDSFTNRDRVGRGKGVIISQPIKDILNSTPYGPPKMHNLHFRFYAKDLHPKLLALNTAKHEPSNNTLFLGPYAYEQYREYSIDCYPSSYNQVRIICSLAPIRLDTPDIMTIPSILSQLRGQLLAMLDNSIRIPTWDRWTMIYCELGKDSIIRFTGERFAIQIDEFIGACYQYYAKEWPDGSVRIRKERQEAPNQPALDAITGYKADFVKASEM